MPWADIVKFGFRPVGGTSKRTGKSQRFLHPTKLSAGFALTQRVTRGGGMKISESILYSRVGSESEGTSARTAGRYRANIRFWDLQRDGTMLALNNSSTGRVHNDQERLVGENEMVILPSRPELLRVVVPFTGRRTRVKGLAGFPDDRQTRTHNLLPIRSRTRSQKSALRMHRRKRQGATGGIQGRASWCRGPPFSVSAMSGTTGAGDGYGRGGRDGKCGG